MTVDSVGGSSTEGTSYSFVLVTGTVRRAHRELVCLTVSVRHRICYFDCLSLQGGPTLNQTKN